MKHIDAAQEAVAQRYGPAYVEIAACAAVAARTVTVDELEEDFRDRLDAYAERLQVILNLLDENHRHSQAAAEDMLHTLLEDLKK